MKHALSSAWRRASLLSAVCLAAVMLDAAAAQQNPAAAPTSPKASPYMPVKVPQHAQQLYQMMHGVDNLSVRRTASGNLLRFSYRVTDPAVAQLLGDKNSTPYLYGERSHALLEVPVMDTIGQLRQTGSAGGRPAILGGVLQQRQPDQGRRSRQRADRHVSYRWTGGRMIAPAIREQREG
ncbi:hypothetical protein OKW50_001281 [Paraburkholderia youngii]